MTSRLTIPTLCFHSIRPNPGEDIYAMDVGKFEELVAELSRIYTFSTTNKVEQQQIVLTFDDGYKDQISYALPILCKYHISAIFFILPAYLGKTNIWDYRAKVYLDHMSQTDIHTLLLSNQLIGSHGLTHQNIVKLDKQHIFKELSLSKQKLENLTKAEVKFYAFPYGDYHEEAASISKKIYPYVFATDKGDPLWNKDNKHIKRLSVRGNQSIADILALIKSYPTFQL